MYLQQHTPDGEWPMLVSLYLHSDHDEMDVPPDLEQFSNELCYLAYEIAVFYEIDQSGTAKVVGIRDGEETIGRTN